MRLYRISTFSFAHTPGEAFSGAGGLYGLGRWHTTGRRIVYCASQLSLAALESLVHIKRSNKLQPFTHYELEVPDGLVVNSVDLPADWKTNVVATQAFGDQWLAARTSALLRVPSVIVDAEFNVLLNPEHPDFTLAWVVRGPVPFNFDARLTQP